MQLFSRNKALAALSLGALAALGACGDDVTVAAPTPAPVTVTISPSNANVTVGSPAIILAVTVTGGATTPDFTCAASPAGVVTVTKVATGCSVAAGTAPGVATVVATAGSASAAAQVTVGAAVPAISGISISPAAVNLQVNATTTITANPTSNPTNATVTRNFVSSNPTVASVNATTGVVTANAPGQATITATLTAGTGATAATVTGTATVTVTANPPAITAIGTPNPASALLVQGGAPVSGTITATPAAGITPTWTAGSSNPGVASATITSAGAFTITAVGPGQAVITLTASSAGNTTLSAASLTAQVPVTVNAPAQVSIADINNSTGGPISLNNVAGQIQVKLNLVTNNNNVSNVRLFICDAGQDCTSGMPAAQQNFGTAGAADGQINLFINTADFTTDFATATAKYLNGQKNPIAVLSSANSNANSNLAILNFNNSDGFAAKHTAPARSAVASTNVTFHGGPEAAGRGRLQIAPVMYTPGRSIVSVNVGTTAAACSGTLNFGGSGNAFPIDYTYGTTLGTATGANATNIVCSSLTASSNDPAVAADLTAEVNSSIDNAQTAGPTATTAAAFLTTSSSLPAVAAPAAIRVDYAVPVMTYALTAPTNGELGWVNASYNFATATASDVGVGARAASTFSYFYTGCGIATTAPAAFTTNTGADIAECATDFTGGFNTSTSTTRGPYTAWVRGEDLLSNQSALTNTGLFGVDKTAPALRYTASTDNGTIYGNNVTHPNPTTATQDTMFSAQALDERSGFATGAAQHILARANQALNAGSCVVGTAATTANGGIGSAFITNPNCTNPWGAAPFIATLADGYQQISPVTFSGLAGAEGYWTYRARVTDRAGNRTELANRLALINTSTPTMTGMGIPSVVTAAGPNAFTPNFTEIVEGRLNSFKVVYGSLTIAFPAVATHSLWDNIIGANGNTTVQTPFTSGVNFYTNIQPTTVTNTIAATAAATADTVSLRPTAVQAGVTNVGANSSTFFNVNLLDPNVAKDDAPWTAASTGKGLNVSTWAVVDNTGETFFSPNGGLKARVVASSNVISSPFTRIDYYYRATCGTGDWNFVGSVDATQAPATSAVAGANVYIADNGGNRVWTYVLRQSANTNTSLTQFVLSTTTPATSTTPAVTTAAITTLPAGGYAAFATAGSNGRVLATQELCLPLP